MWVFLQRLHDLTLVQHESHELVLPLGPGGGTVERPDELQLLQVLEGLGRGEGQGGETTNQKQQMVCLGVVFVEASQTFMTTGGSKWYMELDLRCRNFLNSAGEGEEDER